MEVIIGTLILKSIESQNSDTAIIRFKNGKTCDTYRASVSLNLKRPPISPLLIVFGENENFYLYALNCNYNEFEISKSFFNGVCATIITEDFEPVLFGQKGYPDVELSDLINYAKTNYQKETKYYEKSEKRQEDYDDYKIADRNYYLYEGAELNYATEITRNAYVEKEDCDKFKKERYELPSCSDETYEIKSGKSCCCNRNSRNHTESGGISDTAERRQNPDFRQQFLKLFASGIREESLQAVIPYGNFRQVKQGNKNLIIGYIDYGKDKQYICYGVKGCKENIPCGFKNELSFFIPASLNRNENNGYYFMFQDCLTGLKITKNF